jgi:hypothetical protein
LGKEKSHPSLKQWLIKEGLCQFDLIKVYTKAKLIEGVNEMGFGFI